MEQGSAIVKVASKYEASFELTLSGAPEQTVVVYRRAFGRVSANCFGKIAC